MPLPLIYGVVFGISTSSHFVQLCLLQIIMSEVLSMTFFPCANQATLNKIFNKLSGLEIYIICHSEIKTVKMRQFLLQQSIYVVLWKINPHSSPSIQDESIISETREYLFLLHKQELRNPKQNCKKFIIPIEKLYFVFFNMTSIFIKK